MKILAAGQPHAVVMQHAPLRTNYDGLPGTKIHSLETQIKVTELLSEKPVIAVTLNHEGMEPNDIIIY